jgi:hypothetical protein
VIFGERMRSVGKQARDESGKYPVNENDEGIFRAPDRCDRATQDTSSWPGLTRPSTSSFGASDQDVDARAKPGHDDVFVGCQRKSNYA